MFDLTADTFSENKDISQYKISIQISLDGFSFLVTDSGGKEIVAARNTAVRISSPALVARHFSDWLLHEPMMKLRFQNIRIFVFEELFTLVPENADDQTAEKISEILLDPGKGKTLVTNKTCWRANLNFVVHNEIINLATKTFGMVEWVHPVAVLLNHLPVSEKPNLAVLLQTQNRYFFIVLQRSRLLLANCFTANHPNDLVYQVVNTFQQLKVSRNLTQLLVSGNTETRQKNEETLAPFFPDLKIFPGEKSLPQDVNPVHYHLATR